MTYTSSRCPLWVRPQKVGVASCPPRFLSTLLVLWQDGGKGAVVLREAGAAL